MSEHGTNLHVEPSISAIPLETYQALVDLCARERLDYPIANGSALHARILIDKLFEISVSTVCLITGSLRQVSSDNVDLYAHQKVIDSAKNFLRRSPANSFSIIAQSGAIDGGLQNRFLKAVVNDPERKGTVTMIVPKPNVLSKSETPHFMVSDKSAFRFETGKNADPEQKSITAVANFGDVKSARVLSRMFDTASELIRADENLISMNVFLAGQTIS